MDASPRSRCCNGKVWFYQNGPGGWSECDVCGNPYELKEITFVDDILRYKEDN